MDVHVERDLSEDRKRELDLDSWSTWSKPASTFDWSYDRTETFYVLEGEVTVELPDGESVTVSEGDLARFPEGLSCTWNITRDLRKVFTYDPVEVET